MRKKWPLLGLAFTLAVGLPVPGTHEVRASEGDSQLSIERASENLSLGTDGRSRLYPIDWYPGFKDEQGRFLHDFSYAGYRRGEEDLPKTAKNKRIDVTNSPYFADPSGAVMQPRRFKKQLMLRLRWVGVSCIFPKVHIRLILRPARIIH
ncbi:hypothetical protein [Paenibacillus sp. 1A_MP2]|uniref:hypothetical protein n=1 Tax=Paenibacillus sp. 1A_MP2 TaxID=3457495 RepID=UPI003FCE9006